MTMIIWIRAVRLRVKFSCVGIKAEIRREDIATVMQ